MSPLLALADCLRRREPDVRIVALGTEEGLEARLVPARGYDLQVVPKVPMPRRPSTALLRLPTSMRRAIDAADAAIAGADAKVVVGFGGTIYHSMVRWQIPRPHSLWVPSRVWSEYDHADCEKTRELSAADVACCFDVQPRSVMSDKCQGVCERRLAER